MILVLHWTSLNTCITVYKVKIFSYLLISSIVVIALIWMNAADMTKSYNDSVSRGEELRSELSRFFDLHKAYPISLTELGMTNLPGTRWYGKTIILYKRESAGYTLSFGDKFVTWTATEKEAFMAKK